MEPKPLIIVDSFTGFNPGAENDSSETRQYMAQYRRLANMGAAVILLHHTGKAESAKDYRGSSDIKANLDIGYLLTNLSNQSTLETLRLKAFKTRVTVTADLIFRYDAGQFRVDNRGPTLTVTESLVDLLGEHPGIRQAEFEVLAGEKGLGRNRARQFLHDGVVAGRISMARGSNNTKTFTWGADR